MPSGPKFVSSKTLSSTILATRTSSSSAPTTKQPRDSNTATLSPLPLNAPSPFLPHFPLSSEEWAPLNALLSLFSEVSPMSSTDSSLTFTSMTVLALWASSLLEDLWGWHLDSSWEWGNQTPRAYQPTGTQETQQIYSVPQGLLWVLLLSFSSSLV